MADGWACDIVHGYIYTRDGYIHIVSTINSRDMYIYTHTDRRTDGQADRQIDSQLSGQIDRQIGR